VGSQNPIRPLWLRQRSDHPALLLGVSPHRAQTSAAPMAASTWNNPIKDTNLTLSRIVTLTYLLEQDPRRTTPRSKSCLSRVLTQSQSIFSGNYGFFSDVLIGLREARRIYGFHRPRATRQDENCVDFLCSHPLVTNYLEDQKKQELSHIRGSGGHSSIFLPDVR